ncbi:DUF4340 domain-containing protein [Halopseudomonas bauzanensis]|uniref:DUF4340 domain-containing protein n=1 Tax=Halopseudomonas bauzanensis TaxID=653930 RepID=A0A4U0YNH4_9GAMM|nr:DUF4340 domain-containing protein [Halopseudomonas bauzanensis]TKA92139.1 DUF4340 domain-containing protein [Halopseudomonas bauzanensis]
MRNKPLIFTVVLTAILVALALNMRGQDRVADLSSRDLLSPMQEKQLPALERISLTRGEGRVELARHDDTWGVVSHAGFPVQQERLAALLHALRGARVVEEKTSNPEHHARLGLEVAADSEALQVDLHTPELDFGVIYGDRVGNGQLVRFIDNDQVLLLNRPLSISVSPLDWLALKVVDIPMQQVATARWTHADGETLELDKRAEGDYNLRMVGLEADQQGGNERWINSMVLALINLTAQNVALREDLALAEPMLRMQVTTWAGAELAASLHDVEGRYWLVIDNYAAAEAEEDPLQVNADSRWAYQIGIGQVENLNKRQADIVRSP